MSRFQYIGLAGGKQTGKDTAADYLAAAHGYVGIAFADPLKDLLLETNPIISVPPDIHRELYPDNHATIYVSVVYPLRELVGRFGWEGAKKVPEVRRKLQDTGMGLRRMFGEEIAIDAADDMRCLMHPNKVVFKDVRLPNEAGYIWDLGGVIIRITREDAPKGDTHVSEVPLDDGLIDFEIANDGTVEDLAFKLDSILDGSVTR